MFQSRPGVVFSQIVGCTGEVQLSLEDCHRVEIGGSLHLLPGLPHGLHSLIQDNRGLFQGLKEGFLRFRAVGMYHQVVLDDESIAVVEI